MLIYNRSNFPFDITDELPYVLFDSQIQLFVVESAIICQHIGCYNKSAIMLSKNIMHCVVVMVISSSMVIHLFELHELVVLFFGHLDSEHQLA